MITISSSYNVNNKQISFKSRQNPVEGFKITSSALGDINVSEIKCGDVDFALVKRLSNFFTEIFSKCTFYNYEAIIKIRSGTPAERLKYQKEFDEYYANIFNNENNQNNLTLLVGTDKKNNILAACLAYGYHYIPKGKETTLYVDSLAINPKLRGLNLARTMLDRIFSANKNSFNDVFLASTSMATKFYEKLGFTEMTRENPSQAVVLNKLNGVMDDMDYLTPYSKPLQNAKPRWYNVCADAIKNSET